MIALLSGLNAYKNLWLLGVAVLMGGTIVTGIYMAGAKNEQRKWALEMAERNQPIVEQRGRDEAELAAEAEAAKRADAVVAGAVKQSFILNEETARLLNGVR